MGATVLSELIGTAALVLFRALRQRMMAAAQAQGIFTDEDVFDRVS